MQLIGCLAAGAMLALTIGCAQAQSLSPMRSQGPTPSDIKGFRVSVGNPYQQRMVFSIVPMDPGFTLVAEGAVAKPNRVALAPGSSRSVLVAFKIDPHSKERTIGLCITPEAIAGPILPRVCGTYTGVKLRSGSGR